MAKKAAVGRADARKGSAKAARAQPSRGTPRKAGTVSGPPIRIGHGYDLHRLDAVGGIAGAKQLIVGGLRLEHPTGPIGHSDGDALMHAVTDALLGALGLPDIGQLFPETDPRWAGANSAVFLREAARMVRDAGWEIANIDATVVLERPRLAPHKQAVRTGLAAAAGVPADRVNVKGKTHERVDAVGEGKAIEAHAVTVLVRPDRKR